MAAVFDISPTTAGVQSVSGSVTVTITGAGASTGGWNATTNSDWITISPTSGENGEAVVSYSENDGTVARTGVVTFTNEVFGDKTLTITQEAASVPSGGNIFIGDQSISIMLGNDEIPAIYCGEELLYPISLGNLTGITLENIIWVTDVPASGGTATKDNCTYKVVAHYDSGKSKTVTSKATITSNSITVQENTGTTRENIGQITVTATFEGFSASASVNAYQAPGYYYQYLTFRITSPGKIVWYSSNANFTGLVIYYSLDGGSTWTSLASAVNTQNGFDVDTGDVVLFKGNNQYYTRPISTLSGSSYYNQFTNTTAGFIAEGNIMSLIYGDNFVGNDSLPANTTHNFGGLFSNCTGMSNADNVILPAMTLNPFCYRNLFATCRIKTSPKLPATTLAQGCYNNMFIGCNTLEIAPDLLAPVLAVSCYEGMLYMQSGNTLRYIKCLATNKSASRCLTNFHNQSYVSPTGIFVKYPGVSWTTGGTDGIPSGWTVIESTE